MLMRASKRLAVTFSTLAIITVAFFFAPRSYGDTLVTLPDWNDEAAAYSSQGLDTSGTDQHISDGRYSANIDKFTGLANIADTHDDTEGDDLWTAYQMYKRLDGIHQNAANDWFTRAQNLANFFTNSYVGGSGWTEDASFNFDHIYGWGLCEWATGQSDPAATATVDQIIAEMVSWNDNDHTINPGNNIFNLGAGGRRWGRQLRLAVCAAELSPSPTNLSWRDKVFDIMLQAPEWDASYKMYWLGSGPTNSTSRLGSGAYESGQRISITYHMGIWMDALWHAWRVLDAEQDARAATVRQRLVDMATFYRDIPLDANGFLQLHLGYNVNTGAAINTGGDGAPDGVYSLPPINGLVMAYKFTGDQSYLNRAWVLYRNWQESQSQSAGQGDHFVDSDIASGTGFRFLANNKGELQYVYALFENGGDPVVVGGSTGASGPGPKPMPPTFNSNANDSATTTVTISANPSIIDPGMTATLTWSTTDADSCDATGGWTGVRGLSGTQNTPSLEQTTRFTLTCVGSSGTVSNNVWVSVNGSGGSSPGTIPSWYANAPDNTWINMTTATGARRFQDFSPESDLGWKMGSGGNDHFAAIRKWNGAVAREDYYVLAFGGGHSGGSQNVVYEFGPFTSETPDWHYYGTDADKYQEPSHDLNWTAEACQTDGFYSDGLPVSRHNYNHQAFVPDLGGGIGRAVFSAWATAIWCGNGGTHSKRPASFKFNSDIDVGGAYDPQGTHPLKEEGGVGGGAVYDPGTELIWTVSTAGGGGHLHSYDYRSKSWTSRGSGFGVGGQTGGIAIDPERRIMVMHRNLGGDLYLAIWDLDVNDVVNGRVGDFIKAGTYGNTGWSGSTPSIEYDPVGKKFVGYGGGTTVYTLEPPNNYRAGGSTGALNPNASWTWTAVTNGAGGATPPSNVDEGGLHSRFRYIDSINAFGVIVNSGHSADSSFYVYKVPRNGL